MDIMKGAANCISFMSFKEKYPKNSANIHFWIFTYKEYPTVSKYVLQKLIPFATTWLYETGFSAMCLLKTKHHNRLEIKDNLGFV